MAEVDKPRIRYWAPPCGDPLRLRFYGDTAGWYVRLPGMPDGVASERFDTWPQALARVAQWYKTIEQSRRVKAKIAEVTARLIASDRGSGVRGSDT